MKFITIVIVFLLLIPLCIACVGIVHPGIFLSYLIITDINSHANEYHLNGHFYNHTEFETAGYDLDNIFFNNSIRIHDDFVQIFFEYNDGLPDCNGKDKQLCKTRLKESLEMLKDEQVILLSANDIEQIVKMAKSDKMISKVHFIKIGLFKLGKERWMYFYDRECYQPDDVTEPKIAIAGKKMTVLSITSYLVPIFILVFVVVMYKKKN